MTYLCLKCHGDKTIYLEQRQLWLCASCEYIGSLDQVNTSLSLRTPTLLIYDRPSLHIFLSYGHDRYQKIALYMKDELEKRGHSVWVDVEKLTPGCDWEAGIADALTWVKDAQENGRVLLLMTPHALRRPDGYCLNEIARATSFKLNIFPVMIDHCDPPQSISLLPYFDFQSCLPQQDTKEWDSALNGAIVSIPFQKKLKRLIGLLEACESMTNAMVTSIGGLDHLCLFQSISVDDTRSKTPTYRKLLSPKHISSFPSTKEMIDGLKPPEPPVASSIPATKYVFVYDATCSILAEKLHHDLTSQGFHIHSHLAPSPTDPHARRDAINWASTGKMILFLTPQSVGRPHGVCLNDISAAMSSNVGFVPLMVRPCEIPLSICRIQWFDMTDCIIYDGNHSYALNAVKYSVRFPLLRTALHGKLDHDGLQARYFSLFSPFSFQNEISQYTKNFTQREWIFNAFTKWKKKNENIFWISGQIGSGKSAFVAYLIENQPEICAFHFATKEDEQTQNHRRCILNIAYQLTTQLPNYSAFLQHGEPLEEIVPVSNVKELIDSLLIKPLNSIAKPINIPLIILIDGLDSFQLISNVQDCFLSCLILLYEKLPSWIRLVLTSREDPYVMRKLQGITPTIGLDRSLNESNQDISNYLKKELIPFLNPDLKQVPIETINFIVNRSEGIFLYASHIVNALKENRLTLNNLDNFPIGMGGYLRHLFENQFSILFFNEKIKLLLEILCAAYEPFHIDTIASIMNWNNFLYDENLLPFKSILYLTDKNELKPFHSCVFEWLQDNQAAGPYYCSIKNGHETIGLWAWNQYSTVLRATTDISNLNFELELNDENIELYQHLRIPLYIIRHGLNHLHQANSNTSISTMNKFSNDEKFQLARNLLNLRQNGLETFFHGDIERQDAENILIQNGKIGAFLIRYSKKQKCYCASFIEKLNKNIPILKHNLIYYLNTGAYSAIQFKDIKPTTPIYPDLLSFVQAYQRKGLLKIPISKSNPIPTQDLDGISWK